MQHRRCEKLLYGIVECYEDAKNPRGDYNIYRFSEDGMFYQNDDDKPMCVDNIPKRVLDYYRTNPCQEFEGATSLLITKTGSHIKPRLIMDERGVVIPVTENMDAYRNHLDKFRRVFVMDEDQKWWLFTDNVFFVPCKNTLVFYMEYLKGVVMKTTDSLF